MPSHPPQHTRGHATSPQGIYFRWDHIVSNYTNGIIIAYDVRYRETFGHGGWAHNKSTEMNANITGLEEYFNYTIQVAGITSKGIGEYSNPLYVKTHQSGMIIVRFILKKYMLFACKDMAPFYGISSSCYTKHPLMNGFT